jgi:flagellar hook protein FlgE
MGLSSVMQTALSGMSAATTIIDVAADNLANSQTPGFKAGAVQLATLSPLTELLGAGVTASSAGVNPIQIGRGVQVAATSRDFSQGTIVTSSQPALLALDGEGLFILRGPGGIRWYTRDGQFSLNADGELVTADGDRVLGFGVDAQGNIDRTRLAPLTIQLGSSIASASGGVSILQRYSVDRDGKIVGYYSDGVSRKLGQLRLARFANPAGLTARSGNKFEGTAASGLPSESDPGEAGAAHIVGDATELSNVNIGHELVELTLAGDLFRANLAVFHTADTLLGELFFPWRAH